MKQAILAFVTFVILTSASFAQPKLEIVGGDKYDWGEVKLSDSPLKTKVILKNSGTEELHIQNVKPSCGCTTAPLDKDKLAPGETANLDIKLKVSHGGPIAKNITITSNDPSGTKRTLRLHADVIELLKVSPSKTLRFGDLQVGVESFARATIQNKDKIAIKIKDIIVEPSTMLITVYDSKGKKLSKNFEIGPGKKVDIEARTTPQKSGYFKAKVSINTNHPDYPSLQLKGYGNAKSSPVFNNK